MFFFWLGIQYNSIEWVIMRQWGVSSECRHSSCSSSLIVLELHLSKKRWNDTVTVFWIYIYIYMKYQMWFYKSVMVDSLRDSILVTHCEFSSDPSDVLANIAYYKTHKLCWSTRPSVTTVLTKYYCIGPVYYIYNEQHQQMKLLKKDLVV